MIECINDNELKVLDAEDIIDRVGMAELPLIIYYLNKKYENQFQLIDIGNDCMIRYGNTNIANMSYLATYVHFIKKINGKLVIVGNTSLPLSYEQFSSFYFSLNGKDYKVNLSNHIINSNDERNSFESRKLFEIRIPTRKLADNNVIQFGYCTNGIRSVCNKINYMRFAPISDVLPCQYAKLNEFLLKAQDNQIIITRITDGDISKYENNFLSSILNDEIAVYVKNVREEYYKRLSNKKKQVWLFFDRIDKADDNGEAFFRYVSALNNSNIDCYFVISKSCRDYDRLAQYGNVVEALSFEHHVLLLLADYILTSQLNGYVENPYGEMEEYFRDLYHNAKVVFLQHGVTKDDQTRWLNLFNQNLYGLVATTKLEAQSFRRLPYFYTKKNIWVTGMPRFDYINSRCGKYVLIMPTWRKKYMYQRFDSETNVFKWYPNDDFIKSDYVKKYSSLLNSVELKKCIEKYGYKIIFMPHPIVQPYTQLFNVPSYVEVYSYNTSWRELFEKSSIMVTDYSSVAFDFAYLNKPILYYQFDKDEFFVSHSYSEGYFDYKSMGFGKVVKNEESLIREIESSFIHKCHNSFRYRYRIKSFFKFRNQNNSKRIYERIIRLEQGCK